MDEEIAQIAGFGDWLLVDLMEYEQVKDQVLAAQTEQAEAVIRELGLRGYRIEFVKPRVVLAWTLIGPDENIEK